MKIFVKSSEKKHPSASINAMSTINPQMVNKSDPYVAPVVPQGQEGPIPHLHVYHSREAKDNSKHKGRNRKEKETSFILLNKAEYAPFHQGLPIGKRKDNLVANLTSVWSKEYITINVLDEKGNLTGETKVVPATGYEAAVLTWIDTHESDIEIGKAKFQWDKEGRPIMPDYSSL